MKNKTISSFVYMNELKGIKTHEIPISSSLICIDINQDNIKDLDKVDYSQNSGIYFLCNWNNNSIYVGKAENILVRLKQHDDKKEFNKILFFVNKNNDFSETYINYIEFWYISKLKEQSFYRIDNKTIRSKPSVSKNELNSIDEVIELIDVILFFCNIDLNIVDKNGSGTDEENTENIFYYMNGKLIYKNGMFILLKDSIVYDGFDLDNINRKTDKHEHWYQNRNNSLQSWINVHIEDLDKNNNKYILRRDLTINSPSLGACLVANTHSRNGWSHWKNKNNESLDKIYRQQ